MTFVRLLRHNLFFHWRGNLAVLLGVAVGAAVLTGALLVGDSLRGSLRERAEAQRAGVGLAYAGRFVKPPGPKSGFAPAIVLRGSVRRADSDAPGDRVTIVGCDPHESDPRIGPAKSLASEVGDGSFWSGDADAVVLSREVADRLGASDGSEVVLEWPNESGVPREAVLGRRDPKDLLAESPPLRIASVLPANHPAALFQLVPSPATPRNVFVPLKTLQRLVKQPNRVNALFALERDRDRALGDLRSDLTVDDLGLKLERRNDYLSVESQRTLLDPPAVEAVMRAAKSAGARAVPTQVYLANAIAYPPNFVPAIPLQPTVLDVAFALRRANDSIPYSVVAALDPTQPAPLGPFLPPGVAALADDEIVLADWDRSPLRGLPSGSPIAVSYFDPELKDGRTVERTATFRLSGFVPMTGSAADRHLTPPFPGITDRLTIRTWDPPFPYDNARIQPRDDDYWRQSKTTPKAYITRAAGRRLWGSRFGDTTSIRIAPPPDPKDFGEAIRAEMDWDAAGFVLDEVKARFDVASKGGQDFGGLFLGFSFFLIVAALLMVGLLTRLNLQRRASEVGVFLATGWSSGQVRSLLLVEGAIVATVGAALGLLAAVGFAALMLKVLADLWPDRSVGSFLRLHGSPISFLIGYFAAILTSLLAIVWALFAQRHLAASALLGGATQETICTKSRRRWPFVTAVVGGLLVGIGCLVAGGAIANPQARAGAFFGGGAMLLTAALAGVWMWLKSDPGAVAGRGPLALVQLGVRNAARNPGRSLLTAALLASAAFLLVAVESFRRSPEADFAARSGGSGGFSPIVETDLPVFRDLNGDGRSDVLDALNRSFARRSDGRSPKEREDEARELLARTTIYPMRLKAGDDASCLNLFQAGRPRLLGVPRSFAEEPTRFRFAATEARTPEQRENPWRILFDSSGDEIPVFGEENTLTWMLKKGLGDVVEVPDESGRPVKLRIAGVLKDSIFPSELVMSAEAFERLYPRQEGYSYFLIEGPPERTDDIADYLRIGLAKHGPEATKPAERVAGYMAVENTYLTTFQLLGGFGLVLGALGLAVVLLRGVWERRGELALLRSLGYDNRALGGLIWAENGVLLLLGLVAGVGTAVVSVLPHVAAGGRIPWARLAAMLGAVIMTGLLAGALAVRSAVRAPLLPALRKE